MKVSLNWLSKYVDISKLTPEELSSIISKAGTEIEEIAYFAKGSNLIVGEVIEIDRFCNNSIIEILTKPKPQNIPTLIKTAKNNELKLNFFTFSALYVHLFCLIW